jgi:hypothetical protein
VELTAGPAQSAAYNETEATVTFNGATGLTLTTADFTVTSGGTLSEVLVRGDTVYVKVIFTANDTKTAKTYTVGIAAGSIKIKGSAIVVITQAADTRDLRVELTAGNPVIVMSNEAEATVTFNGTVGLVLTTADFNVTGEGTIRDVLVGSSKVLVTVSFEGGTVTETKTYTVGIAEDSTKIKGDATVIITRYLLFSRPALDTMYTLVEYDHTSGIAILKLSGSPTGIQYIVLDDKLKGIFNAIYTPNAPGTTDSVALDGESGYFNTAVTYTPEISEKVLGLFRITIGANAANDKIELTGTDLPDAFSTGASEENLIVIDIGLPGTADNSDLPTFYIPKRGLGAGDGTNPGTGDYGHIRLRVNKGASLVILADNSAYIAGGAGNSCPDGYFNNGCVEVMAGGKLRDGAYEGFPLGSNAVILTRYGSYLAVGPEPESRDADANGTTADAWKKYYSGYLLGPPKADGVGVDTLVSIEDGSMTNCGDLNQPRVEWDSDNPDWSYLEVRHGEIATNANLTVKKTVALIYSVWFMDSVFLTIDAANDNISWANNMHGLASNENADKDFNFYGSSTTIYVKAGSYLDKRYLETGARAMDPSTDIIGETNSNVTIQGTDSGWKLPE